MSRTVSFRRTVDATAEDWAIAEEEEEAYHRAHPLGDRLLRLLRAARDEPTLGMRVNVYTHCLQSATRVMQAGKDDELVVVALFHDMAEGFTDNEHGLVMAHMLWPWISPRRAWLLIHHAKFQSRHFANHPTRSPDERAPLAGHPWFEEVAWFCEHCDQNCFDPDFPALPLAEIVPIVRRFFMRDRPAWTPMPAVILGDAVQLP